MKQTQGTPKKIKNLNQDNNINPLQIKQNKRGEA